MALITTTEDLALKAARKLVTDGQVVCPACKQPFTKTGVTLAAWNAAIGLEGHRCPGCGHLLTLRLPSPDGL
ncbi:MAG: hypothetical protein EXR72_17710 [Myxococcales bacterium]|nr:hypothetical protein [Myxococcales bacterium]